MTTEPIPTTRRRDEDMRSARNAVLEREQEMVRVRTLLRYGFLSLYVASATISQITTAVLLNYLVASS